MEAIIYRGAEKRVLIYFTVYTRGHRCSAGHAILVDFSLARTGLDLIPGGKAYTFCGSAAYAAPEMLAKE